MKPDGRRCRGYQPIEEEKNEQELFKQFCEENNLVYNHDITCNGDYMYTETYKAFICWKYGGAK